MTKANNISPLIDIFTIPFDRIAGRYECIYTTNRLGYWIAIGLRFIEFHRNVQQLDTACSFI